MHTCHHKFGSHKYLQNNLFVCYLLTRIRPMGVANSHNVYRQLTAPYEVFTPHVKIMITNRQIFGGMCLDEMRMLDLGVY